MPCHDAYCLYPSYLSPPTNQHKMCMQGGSSASDPIDDATQSTRHLMTAASTAHANIALQDVQTWKKIRSALIGERLRTICPPGQQTALEWAGLALGSSITLDEKSCQGQTLDTMQP
ncbi:hypothetical protein An01g03430 [Aspergillus niger]|uniref:Uncharacterized protein n=4 Tax=Aspergillus niger TaxID=5061 RepID=A2Q884_ASPNC|nr:hypothetical protein An01g03430 [Aspergillus niger]CAK36881.1 hypothetical protein An01g03430 [Aspergillus niger]